MREKKYIKDLIITFQSDARNNKS